MEQQTSAILPVTGVSADNDQNTGSNDSAAPYLSEALVSLGNLSHNLACIRSVTGPQCRIMGIVKANAYGHGAPAVTATLEKNGVRNFGVANIFEAIELRQDHQMLPDSSVLAFASPLREHIGLYLEHKIEMTVCDHETVLAAEATAADTGRKLRVQVKIDTGMGRLGVTPEASASLLDTIGNCPNLVLTGIYTHFAESHKPEGYTARQLDQFLTVSRAYESRTGKTVLKHAANSGAILSMPDARLDMVRPGILLYGCHPVDREPSALPVRPVMQFQGRVIFIKEVSPGETVSYNRTWSAPDRTRIATVSAGYADGLHRALSNRTTVSIGGKRFSQVGIITMDQTMIDLGNDHTVRTGDTAVFFGWNGPTAGEQAIAAGTISYELLCSVSRRVKRVFVWENRLIAPYDDSSL